MLNRPVFAPAFTVELKEDKLLLCTNGEFAVLEGPICYALAPHLTGEKTTEQIVSALTVSYPAAEVYYTLLLLENDGYIVEAIEESDAATQSFWHSLGISSAFGQPECVVTVETFGIYDKASFETMLEGIQISVVPDARRRVLLTSDYMHPELESFHHAAVEHNISYFLIKPFGNSIWLGPTITPGETGCWECLKHRLELNRPADMYLHEQGKNKKHESISVLPEPATNLGLNLAALETAKWLMSDETYTLGSGIVTIDLKTLESQQHTFIRRPQCPSCGDASTLLPEMISFDNLLPAKKVFGFRIRPASETIKQFEHLVSPITGVIRSLSAVSTESECVSYVYTAGHSARLRGHSIESLRLQTRDQSGGKGKSDIQAKTSALCESIERFSAVFDDDSPSLIAAHASLGEDAVHPDALLLFSEKQYAHREAWNNNQHGRFQWIPEPYNTSDSIAWTQVWSLTHNEARFIPTAFCYYGYDGPGSACCKADSNGLAAGNCLEEAILHGFLELAERDAVSTWWYNRIQYPAVNLDTFGDPYFDSVIAYHQSLDRDIWVLDVTNDLDIPTFVAVSRKYSGATEDILLGFGAHFDGRMAVTRAILEVNQLLPAVLRSRQERERQLLPDFADALSWWDTATIHNQPYLEPHAGKARVQVDAYPAFESIDLKEMIDMFVARLTNLGMEFLVLDLTRPDIRLSVARVIVPGLRHFWRRLAPGRLYQVPVRLGLLKSPLAEHQLNPISLFL